MWEAVYKLAKSCNEQSIEFAATKAGVTKIKYINGNIRNWNRCQVQI